MIEEELGDEWFGVDEIDDDKENDWKNLVEEMQEDLWGEFSIVENELN